MSQYPLYSVVVDVSFRVNRYIPEVRIVVLRQTSDSWDSREMREGDVLWAEYLMRARHSYQRDALLFPCNCVEAAELDGWWEK